MANLWDDYFSSEYARDTQESLHKPTKAEEKTQSLLSTRDEKLNRLVDSKRQKDILLGMEDADTPITRDLGTIRAQAPSGVRYDAVETLHGTQPYQEILGDKSDYSVENQRRLAARMTNKSIEDVTDQDMIDVGNWQTIQALADTTRSEGEDRWEAPFIQDSQAPELKGGMVQDPVTGEMINTNLNIPVNVVTTGDQGSYGRTLGSIENIGTGVNVTAEHALDPNLNAFALTPKERVAKATNDLEDPYQSTTDKIIDEAGQTLAGLISGVGKGAIDLVDAAQEAITYAPQAVVRAISGDDSYDIDLVPDDVKKNIVEKIDDTVGYRREDDEASLQKAKEYIEKTRVDVTDPNTYLDLVSEYGWGAVKEVVSNPSLTASMISEILGAGGALGAGTKVTGKVASKISPKMTEKTGELLKLNRTKVTDDIKAVQGSGLSKADKLKAIEDI